MFQKGLYATILVIVVLTMNACKGSVAGRPGTNDSQKPTTAVEQKTPAKDLTRSSAAEIIKNAANGRIVKIREFTYDSADYINTNSEGERTLLALNNAGYFTVSVEGTMQNVGGEAHKWNVQFTGKPFWPNGLPEGVKQSRPGLSGGTTWTFPVATAAVLEVSGIAKGGNTDANVDFLWEFRTTDVGQKLIEKGLDIASALDTDLTTGGVALPIYKIGQPYKGTAILRLYDDGWRVSVLSMKPM